ncbi:uncharacterized protein LOC124281704 [Haliotis rubra]|uniref:uncharacterized protein LOC124281704 n=1 Tax=Haliotis rubra TaxID=36100 RepID=UPI001EE5DBDB|nr:uncharacterized protein LOC124281704 [Haliotis rubra]
MLKWTKWINDLPQIERFNLPRSIIPPSCNDVSFKSRHFSDASSTGYGAISYLKVICDGQGDCELLISKSRLAPLKQMTIPHLEMSAAVVSVKLDRMLHKEVKIAISRSVFWTDSTVVLQYIKNVSKRFHVFIANRIALIHEILDPSQWRYVGSSDNPPDDVSGGLEAEQMVSSSRWKHCSEFLSKPECDWPTQVSVAMSIPADDKEVKNDVKSFTAVASNDTDTLDALFEKYSSWYRLKRGVAWILRLRKVLYDKIKLKGSCKYESLLTVHELNQAEITIVQVLQRKAYTPELKQLVSGKSVLRTSSLYRLEPTLSLQRVLCVGGRLHSAHVSAIGKHNMIIPRDSHVTTLNIRYYHEVSGHSGIEHVLSLIRYKFWILKGRKTLSKIIGGCVQCKRYQQLPGNQRMADLPSDRLTPGVPPFTNVGLYCFGPFTVKRGQSELKRYGCIFTCLATRAVHLEKPDGWTLILFSMDLLDSFLVEDVLGNSCCCSHGRGLGKTHTMCAQSDECSP